METTWLFYICALQQEFRKTCICVPWVLRVLCGDLEGSLCVTSIYFLFQYIDFLHVVVFRVYDKQLVMELCDSKLQVVT